MSPAARPPKPMRVLLSDLTGRAYAVDRYREDGPNIVVTGRKHDVTEDVVRHLMALAWARGWNDCNEAEAGTASPNPYSDGEVTQCPTCPTPTKETTR